MLSRSLLYLQSDWYNSIGRGSFSASLTKDYLPTYAFYHIVEHYEGLSDLIRCSLLLDTIYGSNTS